MKKKTNPIGHGKTTISASLSIELRAALQKLADASGMKLAQYIRAVYEEAAKDALTFERISKKAVRPLADAPNVASRSTGSITHRKRGNAIVTTGLRGDL